MRSLRRNRSRLSAQLVVLAVAAAPVHAYADNVQLDGDSVKPFGTAVSFGNVCVNTSATHFVYATVQRNGGNDSKTWADNTSVMLTTLADGQGLQASTIGTVPTPSNWVENKQSPDLGPALGEVKFIAGSAASAVSGTITLHAAGASAAGSQYAVDSTIPYSANVIVCDATPPTTTITSGPNGLTNSNSASFAFTANESATFQCSLDGATPSACTSPRTYTNLSDGNHSFRVFGTDSAGNVENPGPQRTWTVDTAAPDTFINSGPASLSNSPVATFSLGSSETPATFACNLDNAGWSACTASPVFSSLSDGAHALLARSSDQATNTDATPASYSWTVDTTPPAVSVPDLTASSDSGSSDTDNVTKDNTPTFTGTAEAGASVVLKIDGAAAGATTADAAGTWTITTGALPDGSHDVTASAADAAGNTATSTKLPILIDTAAPTYAELSRTPYSGGTWNNTAVDVTWSCSDGAGSGVVDLTVTGTVSTEGSNQTATATCVDIAGNESTASRDGINIDETAPVVTFVPGSEVGTAGLHGWWRSDVTVSFLGTDNLSGFAPDGELSTTLTATTQGQGAALTVNSPTFTDEAGNSAQAVSSPAYAIDWDAPSVSFDGLTGTVGNNGWFVSAVTAHFTATDSGSGFGSGTYLQEMTSSSGGAEGENLHLDSAPLTDWAGNPAVVVSSDTFKVDLNDPTITYTSANPDPSNGWNNSDVTLTWTCADTTTGSGVVDTSVTAVINTEGTHQSRTGTCTDNAGRTSSSTDGDVNLDKTAPQVSVGTVSGTAGTNGWYTSDVTVTFNATDNLSGFAPSGALSTSVAATSSGEGGAVMVDSPAISDRAGNPAAGTTAGGYKIDKTAPTNVQFVGGPTNGAHYPWGAVPAAPSCTADGGVSGLAGCNVTGYANTVGAHTLTATATDGAGNQSTATLTYTVDPYKVTGFYQPVDMSGILNTAKAGSTIPLKFNVYQSQGGPEITRTSVVTNLKYAPFTCTAGAPEDAVEMLASGNSALRYDTTGMQFVYNWKSPTTTGCYRATVYLEDGTTIAALFKLK